MKSLKFLAIIAATFAFGLVSQAEEAKAPKLANTKCPISGEDVDASKTSTYTKVVGFCCDKCLAKFNKDASAQIAKIAEVPAGKVVNAKCPISGEDIDTEQVATYQGAKIGLCCEKCQAKFSADPAKFIAKVAYDTAANEKCPFSGEDIDSEKVAKFTTTVGFCCNKCKGNFDKNPDKHIAKVKFDVAAAATE